MSNHESSNNRRQALDEKLQQLCAGAEPDDVIDDAFVDALMDWLGPTEPISNEAAHYAVTQLQAAMKDDVNVTAIRRARACVTDNKTFGQILNEVRASAGWTVAAIAQRISSDTAFVDRLERDLVPVEQITSIQWADLLEILHIRLSDFTRLATRTVLMQRLQKTMRSAHARSTVDPYSSQHARDLAFAIAKAIPDFNESTRSSPAVDQRLIDNLAAELRARQRTDLLSE